MPTVTIDNVSIYYTDEGPRNAPVLVFSHSLFFNHKMFVHQVAYFRDRYRVICYDHRDQGQSHHSDLESVDMDTLTNDAAALIEALGIKPCLFAGNSMGGFIALRLAARCPELVKGCVVMGSSGEREFKIAEFTPLVEGLRTQGPAPFIDTLMYIMFGDTYLADTARKEEREHWREVMLGLGTDIARSAHGVVNRAGILDELYTSQTPMLVLAGNEDHAYEVALSQHIVDAAQKAELFIVPQAGHSVALEQPDIVNGRIEAFMATVPLF